MVTDMVIDFHSHILPQMDDGSRNVEMSIQMLKAHAQQGTDCVLATPHFYAGSTSPDKFLQRRKEALEKLMDCWEDGLPDIICGAEVAFFSGIGQAQGLENLCVENTSVLLLEMPFAPWSSRNLYEVERIINSGLQPVIVHLERFYQYQTDKQMIPELLDMPVYVQINAESLLSIRSRHRVISLWKNGNAHLLGTDAHNVTSRPVNLRAGREMLERKVGIDCLKEMDELGNWLLGLQET